MSLYKGNYHWVLRKIDGRKVLFGPYQDGKDIPEELRNRKWRRRLPTNNMEVALRMLGRETGALHWKTLIDVQRY